MKLSHAAFKGEIPILDARLLPENAAQTALNVYLRRGTIKPEKGTGSVSGLPSITAPSTLYRYPNGNSGAGFWLAWGSGKDVHVVKSPLANDAYDRVYWTGDGVPKMGGIDLVTTGTGPYPGASYDLGIPAAATGPSVSAPGDRVTESEYPDELLDVFYLVTMVSSYGEESAPSDPSGQIERWDMVTGAPAGGDVELTLPSIPSGSHDIVTKRIYRAESGGLYQFVADVSAATSSYTDSVLSQNLGAVLPSTEWDIPDPTMVGLTALPGGILAGFFGNTLCFSESYLPHAWPVGYQLAFSDDIVALASTSSGLVVVTEGRPRMVNGISPAAMSPMELDVNQPCVSARSLVDMGEYALYASPDGLVAIGGREAKVISGTLMSKAQWQALDPSSIHGYRYDDRYIGFYTGGCFRFSPEEGFEFFDIEADGGYYDIADDTLYLIQGNSIVSWATGADLTYTWRGKVHELPPGQASFSCAKVIAYDYPVTFRLIADGATIVDQSVSGPGLFRLPAGYSLARDWEIEIEGTAEVSSVQIATSTNELV